MRSYFFDLEQVLIAVKHSLVFFSDGMTISSVPVGAMVVFPPLFIQTEFSSIYHTPTVTIECKLKDIQCVVLLSVLDF